MTNVEVDQSVRMEMSGDTVVAASDDFATTVMITARVKQQVEESLLRRGVKPNMVMIRMFVGAILLSIHEHLAEIGSLTIDDEYDGYQVVIRSLLLDRIRVWESAFTKDRIVIAHIGRKSRAHRTAIRVTRGQAKADKMLTAAELLAVA